jgi:uncharacterized membrane protein (DUF485 family)
MRFCGKAALRFLRYLLFNAVFLARLTPSAEFYRFASRYPLRPCSARFPSHLGPRMPPSTPSPDDVVHSESFLRSLMRRQLQLSITCATTFLVALLGMPLLNYFAPQLMATRIAGFTLSWLILGVLFFPFVWIISFAFIRRSIALEQDEVNSVKR